MKNNAYEFHLVLSRLNLPREVIDTALFKSGCDDALIYFRNGIVTLGFAREAKSFEDAVYTAIDNIYSAGLDAVVQHIEGDYLNLAELEDKTGILKQTLLLYAQGKRLDSDFPIPFKMMSPQPLYPLEDVANWLFKQRKIEKEKHESLIEEAKAIKRINEALNESHTTKGMSGKRSPSA